MHIKNVRCTILFIHLLLATGALQAQTSHLSGKVTDAETGAPLPGANVTVIAGPLQTGAATDANGTYTIPNLPPGRYTIRVSFIGYARERVEDLLLPAGKTVSMNFSLRPSGVQLNPISVTASRRAEKSLEAPASISVLEAREITQDVAPSSAAMLRNVTGIDMATTGVDRREIVLRGFNNAFSGSAYILTDYRKAAVPSLDVNLHSIMPNMSIDLERVEIVRGPGSALYGAGVDAGVIHYFTKDPFRNPGTTFSVSGGERSSIAAHFRHAATLGDNIGYKITAQFASANDWEYSFADSLDAEQLLDSISGDTLRFNRDYKKFNINGLLQLNVSDDVTLTANAGFSSLDASLLSGIGTLQADGYGYYYGQVRLRAGKFFAQAYLNKNNAGDSFVYGSGLRVVDNSTVLNLQAQYDWQMAQGKQQIIVGVDYDRTTPDTEGTIFNRNEDSDLISEFGLYAQSLTKISPKLNLTAAMRVDYNNIENDFQLSPRAAIVLKPTPNHSFRATYNRAYDLPGANSLFLDIVGNIIPLTDEFSIIQRGRGSIHGFTFNMARTGSGIAASGLLPVAGIFGENVFTYPGANVPVQNVPLSVVYGLVHAGITQVPIADIQAALAASGVDLDENTIRLFLDLLSPQNVQIDGFATTALTAEPVDIEPLKSTITQSFEVGYKGLLNDKMLFAVDAYYTKKNNFISGVTQTTPLAMFTNIGAELTPALAAGIANNTTLAALLNLAGLSPQQVAALLVGIAEEDLSALPVGVVQPDQNIAPGEILGAYRNFGNVDFWGFDVSVQVLASDRLTLFGNLSFVSDDFFDEDELGEPGTGLQVALNASQVKWKTGFSYTVPHGVSVNTALRFTRGFPVLSGPYVGNVEDYVVWDVGAGYDFGRFATGLRIDVTVQNVLDDRHREFIGAPQIGRLALARLTYAIR